MSEENEVGTFNWAMRRIDQQKAEHEAELAALQAQQEAERQRIKAEAEALLLTPEGAAEEIKQLREKVNELESAVDELRDDLNRLYRQLESIGHSDY